MSFLGKLRKNRRSMKGDPFEAVSSLVLAARENPVFRERLLAVLQLPLKDRRPLLLTAVEQMGLRGESVSAQQAFAVLATDEGAHVALRLLNADEKSA